MDSLSKELNALLARPEPRLDELMATIAQLSAQPPTLGEVTDQLDLLADLLVSRTPAREPVSPDQLLTFLHGTIGFQGDTERYHRPANSFVHRVLERRKGIPLTLAAIDVEVARRVDLELSIVGMPGHVLVGNKANPDRWFDPFSGGIALDVDDCVELFARLNPTGEFDRSMLASMPPIKFCRRMLANLRMAYLGRGDLNQLINILTLSANLDQSPATIRLELAQFLAAAGRSEQAANEYDHLAKLDPSNQSTYRLSATRLRTHRN